MDEEPSPPGRTFVLCRRTLGRQVQEGSVHGARTARWAPRQEDGSPITGFTRARAESVPRHTYVESLGGDAHDALFGRLRNEARRGRTELGSGKAVMLFTAFRRAGRDVIVAIMLMLLKLINFGA